MASFLCWLNYLYQVPPQQGERDANLNDLGARLTISSDCYESHIIHNNLKEEDIEIKKQEDNVSHGKGMKASDTLTKSQKHRGREGREEAGFQVISGA